MTGRRIVVETPCEMCGTFEMHPYSLVGGATCYEGGVRQFATVPSPEALEAAAWAVFPASIPPSVGQVEMVRRGIAAFLRVQYGIEE